MKKQKITDRCRKIICNSRKDNLEILAKHFQDDCMSIRNKQKTVDETTLNILKSFKIEYNRQKNSKNYLEYIDSENNYSDFVDEQFVIIMKNLKHIREFIPNTQEFNELLQFFKIL